MTHIEETPVHVVSYSEFLQCLSGDQHFKSRCSNFHLVWNSDANFDIKLIPNMHFLKFAKSQPVITHVHLAWQETRLDARFANALLIHARFFLFLLFI